MIRTARWSLAVTAALMPLYILRWHIGPIPTTLLETLILITVALYLFAVLAGGGPLPFRTPLDIPIALFLIAGLIGVVVAPDHRGALGILRAYLVEPVAIYYVAAALLTTAGAIEDLLLGWSVGVVLFSAGEIATFARAVVTNQVVPGHVAAIFDINPNSVALYLEPLIGLAAGFVLFGRGRRRALGAGVMVILSVAELTTLSRGGLLALGALAVGGVLTLRGMWPRIAILGGALAGALLLTQLPLIGPRLQHALDPGRGTFDIRGDIWVATARMLRDHPIFGAGLNAYQATMVPYRRPFPLLAPEPYPHNIFLTSWTELGILGMVAFSAILGIVIVRPLRAFATADPLRRPLLWGTGMAFVMVLVHGLVDSPYWKNDLSVEFWLLAAIQAAVLRAGTKV